VVSPCYGLVCVCVCVFVFLCLMFLKSRGKGEPSLHGIDYLKPCLVLFLSFGEILLARYINPNHPSTSHEQCST